MNVDAKQDVVVAQEIIEAKILFVRGKKVMRDSDLAALYEVTTGNLNKAVLRNIRRFPDDFMFVLEQHEIDGLLFQFGRAKRGGRRTAPRVFTEHGILMLSSVLNSERAVYVNIQIMRTFTRIREMLVSNDELRRKIESMEAKYDGQFEVVFDAIKQLLAAPYQPERRIGFHHEE